MADLCAYRPARPLCLRIHLHDWLSYSFGRISHHYYERPMLFEGRCIVPSYRGVQGIKYSVGSEWVTVPTVGPVTFDIFDSATQSHLATVTGSPPVSPGAATLYLYGVELTGTVGKLLSDAPENP